MNFGHFMGSWRVKSRSKWVLIDFYGFLRLLGTFPENLVQIGPLSSFAPLGLPRMTLGGPKI